MYYLFRQILKEKMSKLSDDLKDEEILIQLAETNESIFQIIIKTGADDDMNAILAQETILKTHSGHSSLIQWGASSRTVVVSILPHAKFGHIYICTFGLYVVQRVYIIVKKTYHEKTTLINNVIEKVNDAYDQFCKFEKQFDDESRS